MTTILALIPLLVGSSGPQFDLANGTRHEVRIVAKSSGKVVGKELTLPSGKSVSMAPFAKVTEKGSYLLSLRRPSGVEMAALKFRGVNLLASHRPVNIELTPGAALVRLGSRRFRVLFIPENRVFRK